MAASASHANAEPPAPPEPATTMARGRVSGPSADRSASAHARSAVRTCAADEATCRSIPPGSPASTISMSSRRNAASAAPPGGVFTRWLSGWRASSISSTGMLSRTG